MSIFCKLQNIRTNTTRWSLKLRCMLSIVLSIHGIYIISSEIITSTFSSMYQTVLIFANSGKQIFNARLCEQTERDLSLRALITLIHHLHADYPTVIIKHIIIAETRNTFCWTRSLSNATFSFLITWHSSSSNFHQNRMILHWYIDISIFKMADIHHLGIVLPPYETTHKVSVAGRSCLSNFMSIWYTDLKI